MAKGPFKMKGISPLKGVKVKPKEGKIRGTHVTNIGAEYREKASRKPGESKYQADIRRKKENRG